MRRTAVLATVSRSPAISMADEGGPERIVADAEKYLVRAHRMGADLVAFTEVYPQLSTSSGYHHAEPADGGTLTQIQEIAHRLKMYVVWPRFEMFDGEKGIRNSSILVGRDGDVVGRYFKVFPTIGEMENGVIPGTGCPVLQTDFGRVAMIICFDLNFPELREVLRPERPDLVVFSSMYRGGLQVRDWALDLGCHMLSSIKNELGVIVDPGGKVLEEATYEALATHRCNLNKRQLHMDYNWGKMDAMLAKYGPKLTFDYYTREARYVVGYEGDDRDVDDILAEFDLEHVDDYFNRARRVRSERLESVGMADSLLSQKCNTP